MQVAPHVIDDVTGRIHVDCPLGDSPESIFVNGMKVPFYFIRKSESVGVAMLFAPIELVSSGAIAISINYPGFVKEIAYEVTDRAIAAANKLVSSRNVKKKWIEANTVCPICRSSLTYGTRVSCENGHQFEQSFSCTNLLSESISENSKIAGGRFVSKHYLPSLAKSVIEYAKSRNGVALDFGAGLKYADDIYENCINLEIEPYPTTDIVAAGQALPFPDNTFDGIFSLSVLEHVSDPFSCAREISRVLKPGGMLTVGVPFLFQEHGYPHHYYNMTRMGLANLFEDQLHIERQWVGGVPAISALLKGYHAKLPPKAKALLEKVTVGELVRAGNDEAAKLMRYENLPNEAKWTFAHGHYMTATKR